RSKRGQDVLGEKGRWCRRAPDTSRAASGQGRASRRRLGLAVRPPKEERGQHSGGSRGQHAGQQQQSTARSVEMVHLSASADEAIDGESACKRADRMRDDVDLRSAQFPAWQLKVECRAWDAVVVPSDRASRIVGQSLQGKSERSSKLALCPAGALRIVDQSVRLVEPNREPWARAAEERFDRPRLWFGGRSWAGVVATARGTERTPAIGEVAVQVDAVGVDARPSDGPVWIRVGKQPQSHAGDRG